MNESIGDKIVKWLSVVAVVVVIAGGAFLSYPSYLRSRALKLQNAELQERIDTKKKEIADLIEKQDRFKKDPDFVEAIARQNRRVYPGELVFVFEDK